VESGVLVPPAHRGWCLVQVQVQAPRWGVSRFPCKGCGLGPIWGSQIGTIWTSYGALLKLKRQSRVRLPWSRSGSFNGTPMPGVARELPFKSHFKGEAKFFFAGRGACRQQPDWHPLPLFPAHVCSCLPSATCQGGGRAACHCHAPPLCSTNYLHK
jgi:hypothetical protein